VLSGVSLILKKLCGKYRRAYEDETASLVPLSTQALEIVQQLKVMSGQYPLVFPGRNDPRKTMSEASINQVFKRIGYTGKVTGHGFRHTMSTILHEEGFNTAWIETQLAHVDKNAIRGTYNHALYLEGRREMMQWYADYIDKVGRVALRSAS
jgi:integrase